VGAARRAPRAACLAGTPLRGSFGQHVLPLSGSYCGGDADIHGNLLVTGPPDAARHH
jgi:hypothetical protein